MTIRGTVPEAEEAIAYGVPTFRHHGNLVHFAAFKNHISFFTGGGVREEFGEELATYRGGKGTIQFPLDRPVPFELVERITRHRVAQNEAMAAQKKAKRSEKKL